VRDKKWLLQRHPLDKHACQQSGTRTSVLYRLCALKMVRTVLLWPKQCSISSTVRKHVSGSCYCQTHSMEHFFKLTN